MQRRPRADDPGIVRGAYEQPEERELEAFPVRRASTKKISHYRDAIEIDLDIARIGFVEADGGLLDAQLLDRRQELLGEGRGERCGARRVGGRGLLHARVAGDALVALA